MNGLTRIVVTYCYGLPTCLLSQTSRDSDLALLFFFYTRRVFLDTATSPFQAPLFLYRLIRAFIHGIRAYGLGAGVNVLRIVR